MARDKDLTLSDRIKSLDFYKDLPKELAEPTSTGATCKEIVNKLINTLSVSMFVLALMAILFISETITFMSY